MTPVELLKTSEKNRVQSPEWQTTASLLAVSVTGSLLIALYVLTVANLYTHRQSTNTVERAALFAARKLAHIAVSQPGFGYVGLTDHGDARLYTEGRLSRRFRVTGLNTLYATARVDNLIAAKTNNKLFQELAEKDLEQARAVESQLMYKLYSAVEQRPVSSPLSASSLRGDGIERKEGEEDQEERQSIVQDVTRLLTEDVRTRGAALKDVKITLGTIKSESASSQVFAPLQERSQPWVTKGGMYRTAQEIPVPGSKPIVFLPLLNETQLVETSSFSAAVKVTPSAVLIEASYESGGQQKDEIITRKACAAIGGEPFQPENSAFIFRFPQGKPPNFDSINDILKFADWKGQGEWQQVVGTEVPGKGSLAPTIEPVLPGMSPGDALAVALYHWLKHAGPLVDPVKFEEAINIKWNGLRSPTWNEQTSNNSCLLSDTGAREYALLNQTGPDGAGQRGISRCFEIAGFNSDRMKTEPSAAIPLIVDRTGNCSIQGQEHFDKVLLSDYLTAVYETNLAAIETSESARQMLIRTKSVLSELDQKMFIERQELNSVAARWNRLRSELPPGFDSADGQRNIKSARQRETLRQYNLAKSRLDTLKLLIMADQAQRSQYRRLQEIAHRTADNALRLAQSTYDLAAHSYQLLKGGLNRVSKPAGGFLIGRRLVFFPRPVPITEPEFVAGMESLPGEPQQAQAFSTDWTATDLKLVRESSELMGQKDSQVVVEGMPIETFFSTVTNTKTWTPLTLILNSQSLMAKPEKDGPERVSEPKEPDKKLEMITAEDGYPYRGIRLPEGQLLYYSRNAFVTGKEPVVTWSVIARDLVATRTEGNMGEPIKPQESDWFRGGESAHLSPGLACEFQMRTPLPAAGDLYTGSVISDPATEQKTPQIPPVPADML